MGLGAGFALGVSFGGRWSAELEYAQGAADYDETSLIEDPSGVAFTDIFGAELPTAEERIGKLAMAAPFANVCLRLGSLGALKPYVGVGVGAARIRIDYRVRWARAAHGAACSADALLATAHAAYGDPKRS